jgi:DNA-binding transcriptional MerR regulator
MLEPNSSELPEKRYFSIGEVSELCGVKPHVLRYWEQEFSQLKPLKRLGNRRYYQHHEVQMVRRIRDLLYGDGFTIVGARGKLQEMLQADRDHAKSAAVLLAQKTDALGLEFQATTLRDDEPITDGESLEQLQWVELLAIKRELSQIRELLRLC